MILISVPHGSSVVPKSLKKRLNQKANLREIAEPGIEKIVKWPGSKIIAAGFHQCFSNVNRFRNNIDLRTGEIYAPQMGVFPELDFRGEPIYRPRSHLSELEKEELLSKHFDPFYRKLEKEISTGKYSFLIDAHAMNSSFSNYAGSGKDPVKRPDIGIGNNGGKNADPHADGGELTMHPGAVCAIAQSIRSIGYSCGINSPFRGGAIIQTFASRIPCLQLEINKNLYMTADDGEIIPASIKKLNEVLSEVFMEATIANLLAFGI